ncbi:Acetyl-coenzyme A carboxylase carboxyl transferase subunit alpha [Candidatus Hepatincola sp. Pdp]
MEHYLDFEDKIATLEAQIKDLVESNEKGLDVEKEIASLNEKYYKLLQKTYENLTPWQKLQVARHQDRPHTVDYIDALFTDFTLLAGDRLFAEDEAIIAGIARFQGRSVMIIGIEKGCDLESRIKHNFGMPKPEGYRKAQRLMKLADHLNLPIITFVDTSGAYPGQEAEERGQGEAIARSIAVSLEVSTPIISIIIGEGGSGGAIAIALGDTIMMLEHAIYSVISPEGCASILWRNIQMAEEAAKQLGITADILLQFGIIDKIIKEPFGGAHRDKKATFKNVIKEINIALTRLESLKPEDRKKMKLDKLLKIGQLQ